MITSLNFKCILIIVLISSFLSLEAQLLTHRQGAFLIQVDKQTNIANLEDEINIQAKITLNPVAPAFEVYEAIFDFTKYRASKIKDILTNYVEIRHIGLDWFVENRLRPNDTRYNEQWYTGLADDFGINMEAAWDLVADNVTTENDTIVVAVVDDDFEITHPDLVDNIWVNRGEIPNNGQDDDGNGYTDDYFGWNVDAMNGTFDASGKSHGTNVIGVAGAVPNNNLGIAGVAWNIKMMPVANPQETTAGVIRAYNYLFEMRKLYNETNGQKGAFIVCSNSSFGASNRFPEDFPIWCSLYDSLGSVGILNVAATDNSFRDVGIRGDIPSLCPSEHLIIVSATQEDGTSWTAGFSKTHVDIHAPGDNILTTAVDSNFIEDSGASLSAPMVAGAVGLLYATNCSNLAQRAKVSPASAALVAKDFILNHALKNQSLQDLSVTEAILDVRASLEAFQDSCQPCYQPIDNELTVSGDSLFAQWVELPLVDSVRIQLTNLATNQTAIYTSSNKFVRLQVDRCTNYQVVLQSFCITGSSQTLVDTILTDGCCKAPDNFRVDFTAEYQANLAWNTVTSAEKYDIRYRPQYTLTWDTITNVQGNARTILNLDSCTVYEFEIKTYCDNGTIDFTNTQVASTTGCGSCTELEYCRSQSNSLGGYIQRVTIGGRDFISENDFYSLTEDTDLRFGACMDIPFSVVFDNPTGEFPQSVSIWIDFNQNGLFEDTENLVSSEATPDSVSGTLSIPMDVVNGATRMRISLKFIGNNSLPPATPCEDIDEGEVEDYCVTLSGGNGNTSCNDLSIDVQLAQDGKGLFMHLEDDLNYTNLNVRYRKENTDTWENYTPQGRSPFVLPYELYDRCEPYEFELQAQCGCQEALLSSNRDIEITPCNISNEPTPKHDLVLYPNPNNGNFAIKGLMLKNATVRVFDISGKLVWFENNVLIQDDYSIQMDQTAKKGLYILNISNNFINFNRKFIIN